ncbi:MAG: UDP-glucose 4-epimerase family protein [Vibrio hibernica]
MHLLITGATGFVGERLLKAALSQDYRISAIARETKLHTHEKQYPQAQWWKGELASDYNWTSALSHIDCVIHCAARVHQMSEPEQNIQQNYDEANFHATVNLAKQASSLGVKRFIFISSIKVNGECTQIGKPFLSQASSVPSDPYGLSKYKAEEALKRLSLQTGMEVVIIRPPLVYGQGVKANFESMIKWASRPIPLPLGAIDNQRSMVFIDNLIDLILICTHHPKAANHTFLVSDGIDVSTSQLLRQIKKASQSRCILLPIPMSWFSMTAKLLNKPLIAQRLCGSLQVDISHTQKQLNWQPPVSWEQGISETVRYYLQSK